MKSKLGRYRWWQRERRKTLDCLLIYQPLKQHQNESKIITM